MKYPSFIGSSDMSQSPIADQARTVNWYLEPLPQGGISEAALYPTPGQQALLSVSDVGTRGGLSVGGRTHAVIGSSVYELFPTTATATNRGTVAQDNNPAQVAYNGAAGNQLCISSGGNAYVVNLTTNVVTQISSLVATQIGMLDGYFIAFDKTASKIRLSNLNDGTTWDPTQFAQRSIAPDPWQAMLTADRLGAREIWLIGEQTGEVWYDAGAFPFPFAPIPGALFKYGTPAPFSVAAAGSQILWLSQAAEGAGIVVAAKGYTPQPVSTKAVETAISSYQRTSTITDAEAFAYQQEGHVFYVLKFPSANATWVYDLTTQQWHERGTWNPSQNRFDAWHPRIHIFAGGLHLVGESGTGTISTMDVSFGTEADGSAIRRLRRAPAVFDQDRQFAFRRFQLMLESGLGTSTGQGSNPLVMLRTSDDGGKTWSHERTASAGAMGAYLTRVFWTRLGASRDRVFEVSASDPIPWRLIDAYLNNDAPSQAA